MRVQAKRQQFVVGEDDDVTTFNKMPEMFYGEVDGQKVSAKSAIARLCRLQLLLEEGE